MRRLLLIVILLCVTTGQVACLAQELDCTVEINADKVSNANKSVFNTLKNAISEYMNTNKWTNMQISGNEKIQCKLFFTISKYDDGTNTMSGDLQIQSTRPVYNASYTTTVINFKDTKVSFTYQENEPLVFSETEMLELNGGTPYYEKAAEVVRLAQSTSETGWKQFEDNKNRSAVLSAFTDKQTSGIRELLYNYHRLGLDVMVVSPEKGRSVITKSLETLKKIYDVASMSVCLSMFKDAKLDELGNIYSKANMSEKESVYEMLYPLYPTETERLNKIKKEDNSN